MSTIRASTLRLCDLTTNMIEYIEILVDQNKFPKILANSMKID